MTIDQPPEVTSKTPTGDCETRVPMGPHRLGSQRSLSSGLDLPEVQPTYKWAWRPYLQSR
jgi:hypothetical protein